MLSVWCHKHAKLHSLYSCNYPTCFAHAIIPKLHSKACEYLYKLNFGEIRGANECNLWEENVV